MVSCSQIEKQAFGFCLNLALSLITAAVETALGFRTLSASIPHTYTQNSLKQLFRERGQPVTQVTFEGIVLTSRFPDFRCSLLVLGNRYNSLQERIKTFSIQQQNSFGLV